MNVMAPAAATGNHVDEDLMTRRQVAYLFRVTSSAVAIWARRGRLTEVRNRGRETPVPARGCGGLDAARSQATDSMTGNRINVPRGPARQCTRCGGTWHALPDLPAPPAAPGLPVQRRPDPRHVVHRREAKQHHAPAQR